MRHIKSIFLFAFLCLFIVAKAQLSTSEEPISFSKNLRQAKTTKSAIPYVTMPELDVIKIEAEHSKIRKGEGPAHFGYKHKVDYNLSNSGVWYELPNGDKIWQFNITCPRALTVNLCYDKFWIPDEGKFFVYSKDRNYSLGAFTSKNNKGDRNSTRGFATGLIPGSSVVLEYYQPRETSDEAIISIEYIIHGYRDLNLLEILYGLSGSCQVNVNSREGRDWQNEKNAVALIVNADVYGSGFLIATTAQVQTANFLTANHCIPENDALFFPYLDDCIFYWNYEAPDSITPAIMPSYYTTNGAEVIANNSYSDFALLRLTEHPKDLTSYTPFYLGWDRSGASGDPGVCIHHPFGDIKKISTVKYQPVSAADSIMTGVNDETHWEVKWKQTPSGYGTTEIVSSGSPLLNASHMVIGQLSNGDSNCYYKNASDFYGKFDVSWNGYFYNSLNVYLDFMETEQLTTEGFMVVSNTHTVNTDGKLYGKINIKNGGELTLKGNIAIMGSSLTVESGGTLIIDGATITNVNLVLCSGSNLQIINGGTLEHRTEFFAPDGANVFVSEGGIL